jgi:hypothetical protein
MDDPAVHDRQFRHAVRVPVPARFTETLRGNRELISMLTFSGTPDGGMRLAGIIRRVFVPAEGNFVCGTGRHFSTTCTVFI